MPRVLALRALLALTAVLAIPVSSAHALAPANDDLANAELVAGAPVSVTGTVADATAQPGEPNHAWDSSQRSVWYRWVAPRTGTAVADTVGSAFATTLAAYQGTGVDALKRLAHMDAAYQERSRIVFSVVEGQTYLLAVDMDYGTPGALKLNLDVRDPTPGDAYAAPLPLTGSDASAENDSTFATEEEADPISPDGYTAGTNSLWYEWTAPSDGGVVIDTAGSGFDTAVGVYTGDAPAERRPVASNNDAPGRVTSRVGFFATAGTTYRILVDGYSWVYTGKVKLSLHHRPAPSNDAFATATELPSERVVSAAGDNTGAGGETGEPQHVSYQSVRRSAWYTWTAPTSGSLTLKITGDNFRPTVAAYTGETLTDLKRVANQVQPPGTETNQFRIRVEAGVTYRLAVDSAEFGGAFALSLNLVDTPLNDDFANPLPLVGTVVDLAGSTVAATQEPCEPVHDDNYYDPSVWFTWTAPVSGGVTIDTAGSDFTTVLGIYTGDVLCTLTRVPVNRLTGPGVAAKRSFRATAGVTYRIAVDGANGRQGSYRLSLRHTPPPANDLLADAQALTGSLASVAGSLLGATGEPGETNPGGENGATAWYSWTAPATGPVKLKLSKSNFTGGLSVHTGAAIGSLTQVVRGSTSGVQFRAVAGSTYRIAVDGGTAPNHGDFTLDLAHDPAPPNDDFAAATVLAGGTEVAGTTKGATTETGENPPYYSYEGTSVWYAWTAPSDGTVALSTTSTTFTPTLGAYTGSAVNSLASIVSSGYPNYGGRSARITFRAKAGTTYRIAVNSYDGLGEFKLKLDFRGAPANDAFGAALTLPSAPAASIAGSNLGATAETGERPHDGYTSAAASSWYAWTAPSRGALTIKATSDFQPVIAAYTGTTLSGLTRVTNQPQDWNGGPEQIRIRVEAGTTYYIAVDARASLGGDFSLSLELTASPLNDDFADAQELVGLAADVAGSTLGATQQPCEPTHEQNYYDPSVWFTWTAPESGAVTLDTGGSDYPTVLGIYTGDVLCTLTRVPFRRMTTATPAQVKRGFRAVKGRTYRIAVDGVSAKMGTYRLSLRHSPAPANDMLADAQPLSGTSAEVSGTNFGATAEPGEPGGAEGATVWYSWTAPITGRAKLELPTKDFEARVTPYTGDRPSALAPAAKPSYWSSDPPHFRAVAGTTYLIAVDGGTAVAQGDFKLRLTAVPSPPNDDFAAATSISGPDGTAAGNLGGATIEPGENYDGYERSSVWYTWTAPSSDLVSFDSGYVGEVRVFTGDSLTGLTNLGRTTFRTQAGRTYRIAVFNTPTITSQPLTLRWRTHPRPVNDDFANAIKLSGTSITQPGTTVASTREVGDPASTWNPPRNGTVWYEWTAPADGLASMRSSADDSSVTAYTGSSIDSLTRVGNASYYAATAYFRARAGVTYRIRVESYQESTYGAFTLTMGLTGAPANDDFDNAAPLAGGSASGTTTGASDEVGEPLRYSDARATVWYLWTAETTGTAVMSLGSSGHGLSAYRGSSLGGLERLGGGDRYSAPRFHARAGETYRIAVDSTLTTSARPFTLKIEVQPGPANDEFADAQELSGATAGAAGSTVNATMEPKETASYDGRASVWYRWTAPATGRLKVDLSGSGFDTVLTAYSGAAIGALTSLGTDNDSGDGTTSSLTIPVQAGTTYRFAVNGHYGATGAVALALSLAQGPPNDNFETAAEIGEAPAQVSGTNVGATHEPAEPRISYSSSGSVWYRWTARRSGRVTLDLYGTDFYTVTGVYEGSNVGALTRLTAAYGKTAKLYFDAVAGRTYRFSVDGDGGYSGSIKLALTQVTAPLNDNFASAAGLTGRSASVSGSNFAATWEPDEQRPGGATGASVWYRWTAPANGTASVTVSGYTNSAIPSVYTGSAVGSATAVTTSGSPLRFYAVAGQTYYVRIAGMYGSSSFQLGLELNEAPANDLFADARELAGVFVDVSGSTVHATQEACEPVHDDNYYDPSVWHWWRAPSDGKVTLDTTGSSFLTVLGIYTGDRLCELQRVAVERLSGAGEMARRAFRVTEGTIYRIAVDGQRGVTGSYKLALRHVADPKPPPPPPPPPPEEEQQQLEEQQPPPQQEQEQETAPPSDPPPSDPPPITEAGGDQPEEEQPEEEQAPPPAQEQPQEEQQPETPPPGDPAPEEPAEVVLPPEQPEDPFMPPPLDSPPQDTAPDEPAGDPPAEGPHDGDESGSGEQPAPQDPPAGEAPLSDPPTQDPPIQDPPSQDAPGGDTPPTQDPPAGEAPPSDPPSDPPTQDPPSQDAPGGDTPPTQDPPPTAAPNQDPPPSSQDDTGTPPDAAPPAPAPPTNGKLVLSASGVKQRLADVIKSGVAGNAVCTLACELEILVTIDPTVAKKAKLKGSRVTTARVVMRSFGANVPVRFVVPLPKATRTKLKTAKSLPLTVRVSATAGGQRHERTLRLKLKR